VTTLAGKRRAVNTSPVIVLARVGRLDLLLDAGDLVLTTAVARELVAGPADCPARKALEQRRLGAPVEVEPLPGVLEWGLGAGETSVLSYAVTHGAVALVDDREARRAASALGVPVAGTLALVLHAARRGRVDQPRAVVQAMRDCGLRLDDEVVARAFEVILGRPWQRP
jgi:predicted nucleic acid-binding protein